MQTITSAQTGRPTATFGGSPYGMASGNTRQLGYSQPGIRPRTPMAPRAPVPTQAGSPVPRLLPDQMPGQFEQGQQQQGQGHTFHFNLGRKAGRPAGDLPGQAAPAGEAGGEAAAGAGAAEAGAGAELGRAALAI